MAENTRPHWPTDGQQLPKLDLAKLSKDRRPSKPATPIAPMATDRLYNVLDLDHLGRMQLISPPPEETLNLRRASRSTPFTPSLLASSTSNVETSKRKRTVPQILTEEPPQPQEATPNPKPRKQSKHQLVSNDSPTRPSFRSSPTTTPSKSKHPLLVKSPHALNPDADFIPDLPLDVPRRSVASVRVRRTTPIPPYEPPTEVFTPPREVLMTPSISKSSKRKTNTIRSTAKGKKSLKVVIPALSVKKELPDIDLSAPMPPPSPGDDPLLLSGPILPPSSTPAHPPRERREVGVVTSASHTSLSPPLVTMSLPSSSAVDEIEGIRAFDWARHPEPEGSTDLSMMDMDGDASVPRLPLFDLDLANLPASSDAGGWSDSEDDGDALGGGCGRGVDGEGVHGEGEYTGRWKMVTVRTKLDPPSSATRVRIEEWGRPITPFPKKIAKLDILTEVPDEQAAAEEDVNMPKDGEEAIDEEEERQVRELSLSLDDEDEHEEKEVRQMSLEFQSQELEAPDTTMQGPFDSDLSVDHPVVSDTGELLHIEVTRQECDDVSFSPTDAALDQYASDDGPFSSAKAQTGMDEDAEEEREVRQMSVDFDDEEEAPAQERGASPGHDDLISSTSAPLHDQDSAGQLASSAHSSAANELSWFKRATPTEGYPNGDEDPGVLRKAPPELDAFAAAEERAAEAVDGDSSDDEEESDSEDTGMVKITSADPRAAARAAAILKQHDYDCFTKIVMKERRRQSHSGVDGLMKSARRKSVSGAGIVKDKDKETERRRRSIGVIGDRVYMPGSLAMTLPELLREVEAEVVAGTPVKEVGIRYPFQTPLPPARFGHPGAALVPPVVFGHDGEERVWTKEDWKQLDACFTDARLEMGRQLDIDGDEEGLAPVDCVEVEDVVERFVLLMGGDQMVRSFSDAWSRNNLCQRVKALQNKQRSGNAAPPSTPYTPSPGSHVSGTSRRVPSMEVPDFTPLGRRAPPPRHRWPLLPSPVVDNAPFASLPKQQERRISKLPASLLAPRYSHLLEEAVDVSRMGSEVAGTSVAGGGEQDPEVSSGEGEAVGDVTSEPVFDEDVSLTNNETNHGPATPANIGKRVKGFLFSYLPTLSKATLPASGKIKQWPHQAGLPLPPPEVLEKPRGPISTPVRPPLPKPKAPKELVHLHRAPVPAPKVSMIPRARKPQRLVELQPLPPQSPPKPDGIPRPRRSSGGSVKDLVRSFEDLEKEKASVRKTELKRVKSKTADNKPGWRP